MSQIEWNESFSVNNAEIDMQHKKWIEIINKLHETLMQGGISDLHKVKVDSLKSMKDYVRHHFAHEEEHMRKIVYPGLPEHAKTHSKCYDQISEYYIDMQEGKIVLNTEIMKALMNWLKGHILNEDKKYSLFVVGKK